METYCCWLHPYSSAKIIDRQFLPKRSYVEAEEWFSWIFPFGTNLHLRIHWTWLASTRNFSKWASGSYGHAWPSWRWHYSWVWGELHDPANESCTRVCVSCAGQFQACWLHALTFGAIHVFPRLHISWHFRKNAEQRAPEASMPGIPSSIPGKRQGSMRCSMVGDPKKHPVVYHNFPIFSPIKLLLGGYPLFRYSMPPLLVASARRTRRNLLLVAGDCQPSHRRSPEHPHDMGISILIWLVVLTILKNISQLGWLFPYIMESKTCLKPPTRYIHVALACEYPYNSFRPDFLLGSLLLWQAKWVIWLSGMEMEQM